MAVTTIVDLPTSRALDYKAKSAIIGAGAGDWCIGAFPFYLPSIPIIPSRTLVFNYSQQIINNVSNSYTYTSIGQEVNQVTNVSISSGANSTNNAVLAALSNHP